MPLINIHYLKEYVSYIFIKKNQNEERLSILIVSRLSRDVEFKRRLLFG